MKAIAILPFVILLATIPAKAQIQRSDTTVVVVSGIEQYKKDRTMGKAMQLIGSVALGTYFFLQNNYENNVLDGNLTAKHPPRAIPIVACGVMAIGISIDMGAVGYIIKKRKKTAKVSTEDYQF